MIQLVYRYVLSPAQQAYFRLFRPKTDGVKVVVQHELSGEILVVRHSYGDRGVWHVPGGGYRPHLESAEQAARREIREELALEIGELAHLGEYWTDKFGNRDTTQIFATAVRHATIRPSAEIAEFRWASPRTILQTLRTYGVTRHALALLESR